MNVCASVCVCARMRACVQIQLTSISLGYSVFLLPTCVQKQPDVWGWEDGALITRDPWAPALPFCHSLQTTSG